MIQTVKYKKNNLTNKVHSKINLVQYPIKSVSKMIKLKSQIKINSNETLSILNNTKDLNLYLTTNVINNNFK